jgi:hypothetical protein
VAEEPKPELNVMPFMYRLDPALVRPKAERLERRGPREFFIVSKTRDGHPTENKLSGGVTFVMRGI